MSRHIALFALVSLCLSTVFVEGTAPADRVFLERQKSVYELLWHVDQPEMVPKLFESGKAYSIEANMAHYTNEEYVREFLQMYKAGMLPRGEMFSVFYPNIREQAVALFRVFYYSKDFHTLLKTAAWARIYMNEGLFVYAFSVAVTHHKSTQSIRVPAYHEIYPYFFFDNGVIRQAYNAKTSTAPERIPSGDETIIPGGNITCPYSQDSDRVLSHYTEDVAVNDIGYYAHLVHPFWMSFEEYDMISPRRGEVFFFAYRVQLSRYYMERLANNLGEIEDFDWNQPIPYGFMPSLSYHNGFPLPHRDRMANIPSYDYKWLKALREYEDRISAAIDTGFAILENGTLSPIRTSTGLFTLGNLVEGNADSVNPGLYGSYDRLARSVLGFSPEFSNKYKIYPSLMQQYGSDMRDPMYWSLIKRIMGFYEQFVSKLPKYTSQELAFPGVKIESVSIDKITTSFSYYDYLLSGAVKLANADDKALIKVRQNRLTYKPYTFTINVHSKADAPKSTIRIFLGPKYNSRGEVIDLADNWKHFIVLHEWVADLKAGSNVITRSSTKAHDVVGDELSGDRFYKKIQSALEGKETYEIPDSVYGYPSRMVFPKGWKEGFPLQFLVYVTPYNNKEYYHRKSPLLADKDCVDVPLGFPLDRPPVSNFAELPNAYFKDFKVFYEEE